MRDGDHFELVGSRERHANLLKKLNAIYPMVLEIIAKEKKHDLLVGDKSHVYPVKIVSIGDAHTPTNPSAEQLADLKNGDLIVLEGRIEKKQDRKLTIVTNGNTYEVNGPAPLYLTSLSPEMHHLGKSEKPELGDKIRLFVSKNGNSLETHHGLPAHLLKPGEEKKSRYLKEREKVKEILEKMKAAIDGKDFALYRTLNTELDEHITKEEKEIQQSLLEKVPSTEAPLWLPGYEHEIRELNTLYGVKIQKMNRNELSSFADAWSKATLPLISRRNKVEQSLGVFALLDEAGVSKKDIQKFSQQTMESRLEAANKKRDWNMLMEDRMAYLEAASALSQHPTKETVHFLTSILEKIAHANTKSDRYKYLENLSSTTFFSFAESSQNDNPKLNQGLLEVLPKLKALQRFTLEKPENDPELRVFAMGLELIIADTEHRQPHPELLIEK